MSAAINNSTPPVQISSASGIEAYKIKPQVTIDATIRTMLSIVTFICNLRFLNKKIAINNRTAIAMLSTRNTGASETNTGVNAADSTAVRFA